MRKLNNTLYVTSPDRYLSLEGETVIVLEQSEKIGQFPLHNLQSIVTFGYTGASPRLMSACAQRLIALSFISPNGRFLASIHGETKGNVLLRRQQYRDADSDDRCSAYARSFLIGKICNARWVIERSLRDHGERVDSGKFKAASEGLRESLQALEAGTSVDALRGIEGEAASRYFGVFDDMILQQKDTFYFHQRTRRPPMDNVNALLSFIYVILARECASALETVGLDPYVGYLHTDRPGRTSLALDLVEELRAPFADRFVLSLINLKQIGDNGFDREESGAVRMTDAARKLILAQWQKRKQNVITHPFLNEKIEWGLVPYVQALLLARTIRGDLDAYPPFLWK